MRASNSLKMSGGVVVAALLAASQTSAEIAYNFGATLLGTQPDANFSLGTEFAVGATPIVIDALGAFDSGDPRFSDNERIDADLAKEYGRRDERGA